MCHSFSSSTIANRNVASAMEKSITFLVTINCSLLTCTEGNGLPRRAESASEEPTLQKEQQGCGSAPGLKRFGTQGTKVCPQIKHHSADTAFHW